MTNEEIEQRAKEYAKAHTPLDNWETDKALAKFAFIAGAHSRDEEIKDLSIAATGLAKENKELKIKLAELSNPWISVEERLPEITYPSLGESDFVFVKVVNKDTGAEWIELSAKYNEHHDWQANDFTWIGKRHGVVTHWMPIPQIKKGE